MALKKIRLPRKAPVKRLVLVFLLLFFIDVLSGAFFGVRLLSRRSLDSVPVPGTSDYFASRGFSISPDNRWLVYQSRPNWSIVVIDLQSGKKTAFAGSQNVLPPFFEEEVQSCWSPDSQACVLVGEYSHAGKYISVAGGTPILVESVPSGGGTCSDCGSAVSPRIDISSAAFEERYLSPDQKYVARTITTMLSEDFHWSHFTVVQKQGSGRQYKIQGPTFGPIHWTSDSRRIYFDKDDSLHYALVPR